MSQRQLAKKCGVSFSTISRAEEGGSDIALSSAIALASSLGLSLDWLLSEPECGTCDGIPPEGFICGECGRSSMTDGAGFVRAYECGTSEPAAPSEAAGELSQVSGGGSGI